MTNDQRQHQDTQDECSGIIDLFPAVYRECADTIARHLGYADARELTALDAGIEALQVVLRIGEFHWLGDANERRDLTWWFNEFLAAPETTIYDDGTISDAIGGGWPAYEMYADGSVLATGETYAVYASITDCTRAVRRAYDDATRTFLAFADGE